MRRLVLPFIVATGLVMIGSSGAIAETPAPTVSVPATPGKKVCKITDKKLDELSGIVATRTGFIVINDSTNDDSHEKIFFLDNKCKIVDEKAYSGKGPLDTEDLILSPDARTLWIADIGDNNYDKDDRRSRGIALWSMPADGSKKPQLHRLAYPPGDYHDAEALLLNGDGTPLIVTKEIGKAAGIYKPSGPLQDNNETGVPLTRVGQVTVSATTTPGPPYARIGNKTIDGGAVSPGGTKVVLRTYTDALEWDVANGDVVAALQGKPRTTGLPNETLGEAITYSADGKTFYTVSDMSGDTEAPNYILQYTPATNVAVLKKAAADPAAGGKKWYSDLSPSDFTYLVGGVGGLGLLLVGIGLIGIVRHRKRVRAMPSADAAALATPADNPETELIGVGGAPQRAGVYGGGGGGVRPGGPAGAAAAGAAPGFYGGAPGGARGPVYGGKGGAPAAPGGGPRSPGGGGGAGGSADGPAGGRAGQYGRPGGQQPPRGAPPAGRGAQQPARNGVYGGTPGQAPRAPEGQPAPRNPQPAARPQGHGGGNAQGQRPQGGAAQGQRPSGQGQRPSGQGQRPQGGNGQAQRQPGVYGAPPNGRPQGDAHADYRRPEGR